MPRKAVQFHTDDVNIDQKKDVSIQPGVTREPEIVQTDSSIADKDYLAELAFNEDPITIRLEPSTDKHAATMFPVWNNGKGAEMFLNGRWVEMGWLPVSQDIIVKRKTVATLIGAKIDRIDTNVVQRPDEDPQNTVKRFTSALHSFTIMNDPSPKGAAWATELRRRNF